MEREILFRGIMTDRKNKSGDNFVYGHYFQFKDCSEWIIDKESEDYFEVVSETVGQFTGSADKNGTRIFEGDIVKSERQLPIYNMFEENEYGGEIVMVDHIVKWYNNSAEFSLEPIGFSELMNESLCLCHLQEVVGNIYVNKYLHSSRTE